MVEPAPTDLSPDWQTEIEDRLGQLQRGEVEPVEWDQVEAEIRATLARHAPPSRGAARSARRDRWK